MTFTDWVGSTGVAMLLMAFFLNLWDIIKKDSLVYLFSNLFGAALACYASFILKYLPFIVLEACWTIVSVVGLVNYFYKVRKDL